MQGIHFIQDLAVILVVAGVVGWLCQRIGLSVVVGFLAAGMVVGPYTPPFSLVTDLVRIETAAQVGLVFLMFGIGLRLSLRKLRRLGPTLLFATFAGAVGVYYLTRLMAVAAGWTPMEGLFLAAMLVTSSSAIISKIQQELGNSHEHASQMAMTVTVMEDIVAVVMLTLLGSIVHLSGAEPASVGQTVGLMGAFVVLAIIGGLLFVPWLLKRMSLAADEELQTLGMAALLFSMAIIANHAGYSVALGAFLLGTIVAETPHRHQVERTFEGMRDVFSAVFFVAIGMQIDLRLVWESAGLIVGVSLFALAVRIFACSVALLLSGKPAREALRTGLMLTPIGEFAFIIAQLGVSAAVVPDRFYAMAVGVSLLTTLATPLLTRNAGTIANAMLARQPRWLEDWLGYYHGWLERLQLQQKSNPLLRLSRKRLVQVGIEVLFVSGLLIFSEQLFAFVEQWLGRDWLFPYGPQVLFWSVLTLVALVPLVAIWRNISALAMMTAEVATAGLMHAARLAPVVETSIKVVAGAGLFFWLTALLPAEGTTRWLMLSSGLVAAAALFLLRRKLIYLHSQLEVELHSLIEAPTPQMTATAAPWLEAHEEWELQVVDCMIPYMAECTGKTIAELKLRSLYGCSVVGIERQGCMISLPDPDRALFPRDRVLLLGTAQQVKDGADFLTRVSATPAAESDFEEVCMSSLAVPTWSRANGRTLAELSPAKAHGVQISGIRRDGRRILNPAGDETLQPGDEVLTLGTPAQIRDFKAWLREQPVG